eukprot:4928770-Prymnesium_polylepis.4
MTRRETAPGNRRRRDQRAERSWARGGAARVAATRKKRSRGELPPHICHTAVRSLLGARAGGEENGKTVVRFARATYPHDIGA